LDGTLSILQNNPASGYERAGQDITDNIAVKIGYDDGNLISCQNGASGGADGANTNLSGVDMWWWIK
jgi:hypothetical protein